MSQEIGAKIEMIEVSKEGLEQFLKFQLPMVLRNENVKWNSIDVTYLPPHVERLWTQIGDVRVFLHHIEPCSISDAYYHPQCYKSY